MPLRALRPNRSERDLKRRSTLDPTGYFKRSDKSPSQQNDAADHLANARLAVSEDGRRPPSTDLRRGADDSMPSPPVQDHNSMTRRFSLMRFRHASDSQLSLKAKEQAVEEEPPPVPAVPVDTPSIITTAPTVVDHEGTPPRRRGRMQQFSLRRRSFDPTSSERPSLRKSMDKKVSAEMKRGPFSFMRSQNALAMVEEPGRLSTSSQRGPDTPAQSGSNGEGQEGTPPKSLSVPRASESSRSDESSGGHVSFENTPRPRPTPRTGSSRFGFGRRNKKRASLFPLPMKIAPPEFPNTAPATPRVSTSGISTSSPPSNSPCGDSPPLTAINHARLQDTEDGNQTPPMPSPSQVALAAASLNLASASTGLLRNDSTRSVRSSRSSPNTTPMRLALRGRSATMGSLGARSDDAPPPTPPYAASGRNSTSTAGRSSISNLFGLSSRFRQNDGASTPRHASPALGGIGTPALMSHHDSLNISREALVLPEREEGEAPGRYLERLEEITVQKSALASYLTKTDDPFMLAVLRSYMRKFAFFGDPLDMAIRKLLMQVELPKETQQIDRVLQGFADRYHECNPGIYINPDKAYFISFSVVILHTDFFNKNNKRKMQRNDYIKNSSCEGVSEDVLGCIYDNIVYTPFIRIEDEVDFKNVSSRRSKRTAVLKGPIHDAHRKATREPIDPYTLILEGKLDLLRPNIKEVMNLDDPYTYLGTAPTLDIRNLYKSFSRYGVIQIVSSRSRPEAFMSQSSQENPLQSSVGIVEMPVTKVGVLWRKDTKRKKARSPWQEWGAVLTRSSLSLFRNPSLSKSWMHQHDQHQKHDDGSTVVFSPPLDDFKPDHIIPMDGAVALVDNTYKKHKHAFVMFSKAGEETFLADSEKDLNDWLGMINYSAAFETLGVRPRGLVGALYEGQRNRGIRRLESSHSTKSIATPTGEVSIQSGKIDKQLAQQMTNARRELMQRRIAESEERLTESIKQLEARLRDARHLQILAPIQPKTRELVIHAAGRLAAKLKWARIEIWRMKCHRDILARELEDERQHASDRQIRIDKVDGGTSQPSQASLSPQLSQKTPKLSGLARLSSKASSLASGHKPPLSPTASLARPGTKSSRETDFGGEDAFKTPPETSHQPSPNDPSAHLTAHHLPFGSQSSHRRASVASSSARSPRMMPTDHRPSVSTVSDNAVSSDDASETGSHYTTPPVIDGDKQHPRTPELTPIDAPPLDADSGPEDDNSPATHAGSPESRSKVRRSLHRTLRDSHIGSSHRRGNATKGSTSTIVSDDTLESEGLARGKGSFTVHGKKASVVTFGLDWHNMPAEERLKLRKQNQTSLEGGSSTEEKDANTVNRAPSIVSSSTGRIPDTETGKQPDDDTPRPSTAELRKERHVSSQTITPANFQTSVNGHDDDNHTSEMSGIDEESPTKETGPGEQAKGSNDGSDADPVRVDAPKPQAVEA